MEENYCLRWERHNENFLKTVENFYKKAALIDVTVACEGKLYPAHKLVLSSCSEYFNFIFENTPPRENLIVVLNDIPSKTLEYLLEFIYMGEINVKQNELSSLIRAAQCLKIKGLVAGDICFSEYNPMQVGEHYPTVETTPTIKIPAKSNESNKSFLIDQPVQVMSDYPVIYSQVKMESANKTRITVAEHDQNPIELHTQHQDLESEVKMKEHPERSTAHMKGTKKLKILLPKKGTEASPAGSQGFSEEHTIFLPMEDVEDNSSVQGTTSEVDLLRPIQEIHYDKEEAKEVNSHNEQNMIFSEIISADAAIKSSEASSQKVGEETFFKKRLDETLITTQNCSVVFAPPIPLPSDQAKMTITTSTTSVGVPQVSLNHALILPHPQTSSSESLTSLPKEDHRPRIVKTSSEMKGASKPFRKYLCSECAYSSDFSSNVRRHIRTHTGEKPYRCPVCVITFSSSGRYKSHMGKIHPTHSC